MNILDIEYMLKKNQVYDFEVENIENGRSHKIIDKQTTYTEYAPEIFEYFRNMDSIYIDTDAKN